MNPPPTNPTPSRHGATAEAAILAAMAPPTPSHPSHQVPPAGHTPLAAWLTALLDQFACGLVLVDARAWVHYLNLAALQQLDGRLPLVMADQTLQARDREDQAPLRAALAAAGQGQRRLVTLGSARLTLEVSVVPLPGAGAPGTPDQAGILLVLGAPRTALALGVQDLARCVGLTPAETRVLDLLCAGLRPVEIANRLGVAISTVRTQIGGVRHKAGAGSIRSLVRQVAVMPPLN